jgi:hypothetical protein
MEEKQIHGVVWPVILIGAGLILLLNNIGYLTWDIWGILWRLWPILLIAAGLEILIGRRSFVGSLLVALFLVVVLSGVIWWGLQRAPGAITLPTFGAAQVDTREVAIHQALGGADRAEVVIGLNAGELRLDALPESASLIEGAIELRVGEEVEPRFDVQGDAATYVLENKNPTVLPILGRAEGDILWQLGLNRDVPLQLQVSTGAGESVLDLSRLNVTDLAVHTGVGRTELYLPSQGRLTAAVNTEIGELVVTVPQDVAARIAVEGGLNSVEVPDGHYERTDDVYVSSGYATATDRVDLRIDAGIGRVVIQ